MSEMVVRLKKDTVVGLLYFVEGSGMGNEHSKLRKIYVANNRNEIEQSIREEFKVNGDFNEWLNRSWGSLVYHDNQADDDRAVIVNTPADKPTRVRTTRDAVAILEYDTPCLRYQNVSLMHAPTKLGITGDLKQGVTVPKDTEFTVPFEYARWLASASGIPLFEIVG